MEESLGRGAGSMAPQWISWSALWRGGLLALFVVFVLSTQLLFQFGLYEVWPLTDILLGWLDHFVDQLIVGACIFAAVAAARGMPRRALLCSLRRLLSQLLAANLWPSTKRILNGRCCAQNGPCWWISGHPGVSLA